MRFRRGEGKGQLRFDTRRLRLQRSRPTDAWHLRAGLAVFPRSWFDAVVFALAASLVALGLVATLEKRAQDLNLTPLLVLPLLGATQFWMGWRGLSRAYSSLDRMRLLFGEVLVVGSLLIALVTLGRVVVAR